MQQKYNLQPAVTTGNELQFAEEHHAVETSKLPVSFDLRTVFPTCIPPILDQGKIGACAANELSNALRYCIAKENGGVFQPSRLFLYYFGRLYEGSNVNQDTGMSISGACGAVTKYGACSENNWIYDITKFTIQPPRHAIIAGHTHCSGYQFLQVPQDLIHIKQALFSGFPVLIGIQVYSSFETDAVIHTGIVPMPNIATEKKLGGHCMAIYSFDDITQTFGMMNSWGQGTSTNPIGKYGWFTIPYAYLLDPNLSGDFAQVRYFK